MSEHGPSHHEETHDSHSHDGHAKESFFSTSPSEAFKDAIVNPITKPAEVITDIPGLVEAMSKMNTNIFVDTVVKPIKPGGGSHGHDSHGGGHGHGKGHGGH